MFGEVDVGAVAESDSLGFKFGVLLETATESVGFGEFAVLGNNAVTGGSLAIGVTVEGMTDTASITGTERAGQVSIGGYKPRRNLLDKRVDAGKKL